MAFGENPADGWEAPWRSSRTRLVFDGSVSTPNRYVTSPALDAVLGDADRYAIHAVVSEARGTAPGVTVEYQCSVDDEVWLNGSRGTHGILLVGGSTVLRTVGTAPSLSRTKAGRLSIVPTGLGVSARVKVWLTLWRHFTACSAPA